MKWHCPIAVVRYSGAPGVSFSVPTASELGRGAAEMQGFVYSRHSRGWRVTSGHY